MFVSGYENDSVYEYTLSTAWDVSTAVLADTFSVGTVVTEPRDINFFSRSRQDVYRVDAGGWPSLRV